MEFNTESCNNSGEMKNDPSLVEEVVGVEQNVPAKAPL